MASRSKGRVGRSISRGGRQRRSTFKLARRFIRLWLRAFRKSVAAYPPPARILVGAAVVLFLWSVGNWVYQTINKPTEMFFPLDDALDKSPAETWRQYGSLFREHSTAVITPELLAALAQVEGGGNPVARTFWRWQFSWNPFQLYQPASSAVGMFQITDAAFQEAKHYCVHDHVVVEDGRWNDMNSCWFNSFYMRAIPSHAIELTAALLDQHVASAMKHHRLAPATPQQRQDLAAVIHLCGVSMGNAYAKRGFRLVANQRCVDHDVADYLAKVNGMKRRFTRLAAAG